VKPLPVRATKVPAVLDHRGRWLQAEAMSINALRRLEFGDMTRKRAQFEAFETTIIGGGETSTDGRRPQGSSDESDVDCEECAALSDLPCFKHFEPSDD